MTDPPVRVDPLRLRHARGERLRGLDAADQSAQDDQLRWLHNRGVHRAYGIVTGLDVTVEGGVAAVDPGLAYDRRGRELVLREQRRVPVPPGGETLHLVPARRGDGVRLCWLPPGSGARVGVRLGGPGVTDPPRARPVARPVIGRGATLPGATAWEPWSEVAGRRRELHLGMQVVVDTSTAGFTATPCYSAQITGTTWDARLPLMLLVPFEHVARQGRDRFTFRLLMPWLYLLEGLPTDRRSAAAGPDYREAFRGLAQITDLAVTWIGIQHRTEGQP